MAFPGMHTPEAKSLSQFPYKTRATWTREAGLNDDSSVPLRQEGTVLESPEGLVIIRVVETYTDGAASVTFERRVATAAQTLERRTIYGRDVSVEHAIIRIADDIDIEVLKANGASNCRVVSLYLCYRTLITVYGPTRDALLPFVKAMPPSTRAN